MGPAINKLITIVVFLVNIFQIRDRTAAIRVSSREPALATSKSQILMQKDLAIVFVQGGPEHKVSRWQATAM